MQRGPHVRGSSSVQAIVDTKEVTLRGDNDGEERDPARSGQDSQEGGRPRLRAVTGPSEPSVPPPPVRLVREYKGLTVADMMRDEIVDRLPAQARAALHHLRRGDFEAAERALPGEFGTVLPGPGAGARHSPRWTLWLAVTAVLFAGYLASRWL